MESSAQNPTDRVVTESRAHSLLRESVEQTEARLRDGDYHSGKEVLDARDWLHGARALLARMGADR
jgi:hypothetical protein